MKLSEKMRKVTTRGEGLLKPPPPEQVDDWADQAEAEEQDNERLIKTIEAYRAMHNRLLSSTLTVRPGWHKDILLLNGIPVGECVTGHSWNFDRCWSRVKEEMLTLRGEEVNDGDCKV